MFEAGHLSGGAAIYKRYPIRASLSVAGIPAISVTNGVGIAPGTTTSYADAVGLTRDTATYSTTQADLDDPGSDANVGAYGTITGLDMGKVVTVSIRPDLIIRARISGSSTAGTAMTTVTNTSASSGGTTITDTTNIGSNDMTGGFVYCIKGANVGHARAIATHNASTSFVVTVPFPRGIAVGDQFLWVPYTCYGTGASGLDGVGNVQATSNIAEADGSIASGTGGESVVVSLDLNGASDSYVHFLLADHQLFVATN